MKILILGIGNILFGDEGVGVFLAHTIKANYHFEGSHELHIVDGGTMAQHLIPIITEYDYIIILDTVDANNANIGDVFFFDYDDVPPHITWQGSAHEVEMLQTLQMTELLGDRPPTKIIGVIPYIIGEELTFALTQKVYQASFIMEQTLINHLITLKVNPKKIANYDIQDIAKTAYKGFI